MSQIMDKLGISLDKWERHQDTYNSIVWKGDPQCTESEWKTAVKNVKDDFDNKQYQRDRQYPELGEQLDMLFHDMTAGKGDKTGEWYKAIAKVKADHPKP